MTDDMDWSEGRAPVCLGDRVKIIGIMADDPDPLPVGVEGTVDWLNTFSGGLTEQIGVAWDNQRKLHLLPHDPFLLIKPTDQVANTMFVRPRNPDDHREFETLLPQLTPSFFYTGGDGMGWVRWAVPVEVAVTCGWEDMRCACCGERAALRDDNFVYVDTAWHEVDWWFSNDRT